MEHKETNRIVPGARFAVLFLHGIVGTPNHFRLSMPLEDLVPEDWSVRNILLPGHGGSVEEFGRSSMPAWRQYVRKAFLELAREHERIVIVGHSMGTLFAMDLALEFREKACFLFLLNVPMRPWIRLFGAVNCLRLAFGRIRENKPLEVATRNVCGVETTPLLWKYIPWIPRFLELFVLIHSVEKSMGKLDTPCVAFQSRKDELVSNRSATVLIRSGVMEVRKLEHSTHFYYAPADQAAVDQAFTEILCGISTKNI